MPNRADYMKAWRLANTEKLKAYHRGYYLTHQKQVKSYILTHKDHMKEYQKAYDKVYRITHHDRIKERRSIYYQAHKEEFALKSKIYRAEHKEQIKTRNSEYKLAHREKLITQSRIYSVTHREKIKAYLQSQAGKASNRRNSKKMKAKRKQFGFIPLNEYFDGSHGHHINKEMVIFIPKELHESTRHSVLQNRNMETINKKSFDFMEENGGTIYGKEMDYTMPSFTC